MMSFFSQSFCFFKIYLIQKIQAFQNHPKSQVVFHVFLWFPWKWGIGMLQTSSNLETAVSLLAASVFTMFYAHDSYVYCTETLTHLLKLVCQLIPGVFHLKHSNPETKKVRKPGWVARIPTFRLTNIAAGKWYLWGTRYDLKWVEHRINHIPK